MFILESIRNKLISSSRRVKIILMMINDLFCFFSPFLFSLFIKYFVKLNNNTALPVVDLLSNSNMLIILIINLLCIVLIYSFNGYRSFLRYSNENLLNALSNPRLLVLFLYFLATLIYFISDYKSLVIPISSALSVFLTTFFSVVFLRSLAYRFIKNSSNNKGLPLVIYGAGQAGRELAAYLGQNELYRIIGFIDDDHKLKNFKILGYKVYGNFKQIEKLKNNYSNLEVILSIINIKPTRRQKIISNIEKFQVAVKTIPEGYGSLTSKMSIQNLNINDLLERKEVPLDKKLLKEHIENKRILITGAGGSIGSEISLKIASLKPDKMIFIDFSELNLYDLKNKLINFDTTKVKFFLLNLVNIKKIEEIIKKEKIDIIFHAAAYKHVPILEDIENFNSAIENNFLVTFNLCKIALDNQIESFTLISTDKAVNPTNIMGASKRLAELGLQAFQKEPKNKTRFSMVRFGNVLNSSGSVVPLFWDQINSGGPVTVTHEKINRFFMSIREAANLVIQSSSIAEGGEVFLLDMGNPIEIKI